MQGISHGRGEAGRESTEPQPAVRSATSTGNKRSQQGVKLNPDLVEREKHREQRAAERVVFRSSWDTIRDTRMLDGEAVTSMRTGHPNIDPLGLVLCSASCAWSQAAHGQAQPLCPPNTKSPEPTGGHRTEPHGAPAPRRCRHGASGASAG